jgi:hypothetical protein
MSGVQHRVRPCSIFFSYSTVVDGAQGCASLVRGMVTTYRLPGWFRPANGNAICKQYVRRPLIIK